MKKWLMILMFLPALSCSMEPMMEEPVSGSFGNDLSFLEKHTDVIVLSDPTETTQVAVVPAWQGRVMTSTSGGLNGPSFGWIHYELIQSGEIQPHINVFGGEDRFWMGPEGGQFAIFFQEGSPFDLENWQTPAFIDTVAYRVTERDRQEVSFEHEVEIQNYSRTRFNLKIERTVRLMSGKQVGQLVDSDIEGLRVAAFESENRVTNTGDSAWVKEGGLLSIWILGMYNPSPETTIVIPFIPGPESELGSKVNDAYFGKIASDRLKVLDDVLFFKGDGESRGKIGISPQRARPFLGSWDRMSGVLTVVHFNLPDEAPEYVNSMWEFQKEPFAGDAVNSYNDGPPEPGAEPLGPFYELETSSPALKLKPGEAYTHFHRTMHFSGDESAMDTIAVNLFGVSLLEIESAFD